MMYQFKIQWIFPKAEAIKAVDLLGARSLDFVEVRGHAFRILEHYDNMTSYGSIEANKKLKQWIRNADKKYGKEEVVRFDFVRK